MDKIYSHFYYSNLIISHLKFWDPFQG